jgi:hypothetical protein
MNQRCDQEKWLTPFLLGDLTERDEADFSRHLANCASCPGIHNILASTDPRSSIHPKNLKQTCGRCHPGVSDRISSGPVHVRSASISEHKVVRWIRLAYWALIPLTIGFMVIHNWLDWFAKLRRGKHHGATGELLPRMNLKFRITHGLSALSFIVLVVSGFALKYPEADWVKFFLFFDPPAAFRGVSHRWAYIAMSGVRTPGSDDHLQTIADFASQLHPALLKPYLHSFIVGCIIRKIRSICRPLSGQSVIKPVFVKTGALNIYTAEFAGKIKFQPVKNLCIYFRIYSATRIIIFSKI